MKKTLLAFLIIITLAFTVINAMGESGDPFAVGISLFNRADYVAATQELAKAVEQKPGDTARRITYGVALANMKRYNEAITQFQAAADLDPKDPIPHFLLEAAYTSKNSTSSAADQKRLGRDMLTSIIVDGAAVRQVDQVTASRGTITLPPPPRPNSFSPGKPGADLSLNTGKLAMEKDLAVHPDNAIAHTLLGDTYQLAGRYDEAVAHYRTAVDLAPKWTKPWFNLGMININVNPSQSVMCFNRVIELDPSNQEAKLRLGDALSREKNYTQAIQAYNNVAGGSNLNAQAKVGVGNIYIKQQKLDQAEQQFDSASQMNPQSPVPYAGKAEVYSRKQMPQKSAREYQFAMANSTPTQQAGVSNKVADAFVQNGDFNGAIRELQGTIAQNSPLRAPVPILVNIYQKAGMLAKGIADYETALQKNPADIVAMRFLLDAYRISQQPEKQAMMARKLIKSAPSESPTWNYQLGYASAVARDNAGAIAAWRTGLEIEPGTDRGEIIPGADSFGLLNSLAESYKMETVGRRAEGPYLILSSICEYKRDYRQAAEILQKLTVLYPGKQVFWIYLGDDLNRCGDKTGAMSAFKRASQMNDNPTLRAVAIQRLKDTK